MGTTRKDRELNTEAPRASGALSSDRVADSYRPDGTWSCTRDHRTTPCGDCDGCRYVQGANAADRAAANDEPLPLQSAFAVPRADDAEDLDIPYPCGLDQRAAVNGTYAPASSYRYRPDLDHGDDPLSRTSLARLAGRPLR